MQNKKLLLKYFCKIGKTAMYVAWRVQRLIWQWRMKHELLTKEYDFSPKCQPADGAAYLCSIPDCFLGNIRRGNHLLLLLSHMYY